MAQEIKSCPSCSSTDIQVDGNKVFCQTCSVEYEITETGARVSNIDPMGDFRKRLDKTEKDVAGLIAGQVKQTEGPPTPTPTPAPTSDDDDKGGFIELED